jgi:[amino group carrier protein]-lysine/ornithine hydrolase
MVKFQNSETLVGLVSIYSPSGSEKEAVEYLVSRFEQLNYTQSYVDKVGNAIGIMGKGSKQLVLLGHIDTVPGDIPVRVEEGILYGRGAVDANGPLAAFVDSVGTVGEIEGWQIVVIGAIDEERDSIGAYHIVDKFNPEYAIVGEPSNWDRVTLGYKGISSGEILVKQSKTHSASQYKTASEVALDYWIKLKNWQEIFNNDVEKLFTQIQLSLNEISSGEDGFEEWAQLNISVRLPEAISPEAFNNQVIEEIGSGIFVQSGFGISAYRSDRNNLLVRSFSGAIRNEGGKPRFVSKTGTADFNIVAPIWECPIVAYGPGDSSLDHTPNEHIVLSEYHQACNILRGVIERICA